MRKFLSTTADVLRWAGPGLLVWGTAIFFVVNFVK